MAEITLRGGQVTWRSAAASSSLHAAQRANELLAAGDMDGRAVWHRIERAIDELQPAKLENEAAA